jgi:hypothetical protein
MDSTVVCFCFLQAGEQVTAPAPARAPVSDFGLAAGSFRFPLAGAANWVKPGRHFPLPPNSLRFPLWVPLALVGLAVPCLSFRSLIPFPASCGHRFPLSALASFLIYHCQVHPQSHRAYPTRARWFQRQEFICHRVLPPDSPGRVLIPGPCSWFSPATGSICATQGFFSAPRWSVLVLPPEWSLHCHSFFSADFCRFSSGSGACPVSTHHRRMAWSAADPERCFMAGQKSIFCGFWGCVK